MAYTTMSSWFREQQADLWYRTLAELGGFISVGDGGCDPETAEPIAPSPDSTSLRHPLVTSPLVRVSRSGTNAIIAVAEVSSDLVGKSISEVALLDREQHLIGQKSFQPKKIDSDERYEIRFDLYF
jgi:hypothetical protein